MTDEKLFYDPQEAAAFFGISVAMLGYYRRTGRIEGIGTGNSTVYTLEQLQNAKIVKKKPGPPRKPGSKRWIQGQKTEETPPTQTNGDGPRLAAAS